VALQLGNPSRACNHIVFTIIFHYMYVCMYVCVCVCLFNDLMTNDSYICRVSSVS